MNMMLRPSPNATDFALESRPGAFLRRQASAVTIADDGTGSSRLTISAKKPNEVVRSVPQQLSFDERIFDALVRLKVAVSHYAMHLPATERTRLFSRLDEVINKEDWHEEDQLPIAAS